MELRVITLELIFCVCVLLTQSVGGEGSTSGLYSDQDQVTILDNTTYHTTLEGRNHAWLVEFYASWCGYCQNLAPTFAALSREMATWGDVIKVAVIDCGDVANNQAVCKHADIKGFPTLKYFPPNKTREELGVNRPNQHHDKEGMKHDTIDFIEDMIVTLQHEDPSSVWPNLRQMNSNLSNVGWSDLWPHGNTYTFLVVETENSYIGREVILNTWRRHKPHPVVERFVLSEGRHTEQTGHMSVLDKLGVKELPAVIVLGSHNQSLILLQPDTRDVTGIVEAISEYLESTGQDMEHYTETTLSPVPAPVPTSTHGRIEVRQEDLVRRRYSVYLSDLENTVLYSLHNEVSVKEEIDVSALREFGWCLHQYFPSHSYVSPLLSMLWTELSQHNSSSIRPEELPSLSTVSRLAPVQDWVGCAGSSPQYGGYPCGLWMLWHTLVQAHTDNTDPGMVLRAMVAYIREFFSCRECAEHFMEMVRNGTAIEEQVTSTTDSILFLWAAHNAVNLRLSSSPASNDPLYPKFEFPSPSQCPHCWSMDGTPQEEAILTFLSRMYSSDNILGTTSAAAAAPSSELQTGRGLSLGLGIVQGVATLFTLLIHLLIL